jgi:hypothetical protein
VNAAFNQMLENDFAHLRSWDQLVNIIEQVSVAIVGFNGSGGSSHSGCNIRGGVGDSGCGSGCDGSGSGISNDAECGIWLVSTVKDLVLFAASFRKSHKGKR